MVALVPCGARAWTLALMALAVGGEHFLVRRPMSCLPLESESFAASSRVVCAAICQTLQGMAFKLSGGRCEVRGAGRGEDTATHLFIKFSEPEFQLKEASRGKAVEATEHYISDSKDLAIDGSRNTMYHSASGIASPWWKLDLGDQRKVMIVKILTRQDRYDYRFHDIEIRVGATPSLNSDFSSWPLLAFYKGPYSMVEGVLTFESKPGICGRYVVIHKVSSDFDHLQLVDVEIHVRDP